MIYSVALVFSAYQDLLCHFADQAFIVAYASVVALFLILLYSLGPKQGLG